jgi:hypothetical protein
MSAQNQLRLSSRAVPDMQEELDECSCGVAVEASLASAYNEEAFRYFLEIERKRSQVANRPLLLLLVDLTTKVNLSGALENGVSAKVFVGLSQSLRETDVVGWYREGQVIGAVLTRRADAPEADASAQLIERVTVVLHKSLPAAVAGRLQVRVYELPSSVAP